MISGFEYILDKNVRAKICFGSGIPREVLPRSGPAMSPFMREMGASAGTSLDPYEEPPIFSDPRKKVSTIWILAIINNINTHLLRFFLDF